MTTPAEGPAAEEQQDGRCDNAGGTVASGWDVVVPEAWGSAFWTAFVMAGSHVIGLDERNAAAMDSGTMSFPRDCPDAESYSSFWSSPYAMIDALNARFAHGKCGKRIKGKRLRASTPLEPSASPPPAKRAQQNGAGPEAGESEPQAKRQRSEGIAAPAGAEDDDGEEEEDQDEEDEWEGGQEEESMPLEKPKSQMNRGQTPFLGTGEQERAEGPDLDASRRPRRLPTLWQGRRLRGGEKGSLPVAQDWQALFSCSSHTPALTTTDSATGAGEGGGDGVVVVRHLPYMQQLFRLAPVNQREGQAAAPRGVNFGSRCFRPLKGHTLVPVSLTMRGGGVPYPGKCLCVALDSLQEHRQEQELELGPAEGDSASDDGDVESAGDDDTDEDREVDEEDEEDEGEAPGKVITQSPHADPGRRRASLRVLVIGFVTSGHFSERRGTGFGLGLCSVPGLQAALSLQYGSSSEASSGLAAFPTFTPSVSLPSSSSLAEEQVAYPSRLLTKGDLTVLVTDPVVTLEVSTGINREDPGALGNGIHAPVALVSSTKAKLARLELTAPR